MMICSKDKIITRSLFYSQSSNNNSKDLKRLMKKFKINIKHGNRIRHKGRIKNKKYLFIPNINQFKL